MKAYQNILWVRILNSFWRVDCLVLLIWCLSSGFEYDYLLKHCRAKWRFFLLILDIIRLIADFRWVFSCIANLVCYKKSIDLLVIFRDMKDEMLLIEIKVFENLVILSTIWAAFWSLMIEVCLILSFIHKTNFFCINP